MLHRRRREEGDNPAWPGLVDVFAFTLVFVILLSIANDSKNNINQLIKENKQLQQEKKKLEEKYAELKKGVTGLRELKEFYDILKNKLPKDYEIDIDEDAIEIIINGVPPIYFETGEYKLSVRDSQRLSRLASLIYPLIHEKPFYVLINGTADPRYLYDRGIPPHNNVELSALRSATVADLMEKIAPGVGKYLRVAGLGVRGEEAPPGVDRDKYYQQFRTINLVIKVDVEKLRFISKEEN
ncbi:MAG: hypothetical protein QXT73_02685 [Candidatus Methanomethylicaceae archaeon]